MKEAKVYDSYRVEKVQLEDCSVLRVIAFSELDPQSITHGSEVELGEYIPSLHAVRSRDCQSGAGGGVWRATMLCTHARR